MAKFRGNFAASIAGWEHSGAIMKRGIEISRALVIACLAVNLIGCGGSSSSPPPPPPAVGVSVSPMNPTLHAGVEQTFTATVNNDPSNKGLTWSVSCSTTLCGWVLPAATASGAATTYIVPSVTPSPSPTVKLTATSVADSSKSSSVTVNIVPAAPAFAYTGGFYSGTVSGFSVDAGTGALTALSGSPFPSDGERLFSLAVDRLSRFLYAASDNSGNLLAFTISPSSGALTPVAGSPYGVGAYPQSVTIDPTGRFAYVANANSNNVSAFTIDASSGALTAIAGSPFGAGQNPDSVAVDPSGRFAYVGSSLFPAIASFSINASTGMLTITGSPNIAPAVGCDYSSTVVDPMDRFVFMMSPCNGVYAFTLDATTGTLTLVSGSPFAFNGGAIFEYRWLAEEPTGRFLYVTDRYNDTIVALAIDPSTGAVSQISGSPFAGPVNAYSFAIDPSGQFAYVTDENNSVFAFVIDPSTGALSPMTGSPFATGFEPAVVAIAGKAP